METMTAIESEAEDRERLAREDFDAQADWVIAEYKRKGYERGFEIDAIHFSGFYSQGDGACWVGLVQFPAYIEWRLREGGIEGIPDGILELMYWMFRSTVFDPTTTVYKRGHYQHSKTMELGEYYYGYAAHEECMPNIEDAGPFRGAPLPPLLEAAQWSSSLEEGKYFTILWETLLKDVRDYADEVYRELEERYHELCVEPFA